MEAVLISYSLTDEQDKNFLNTHFTGSGIKIDDRWILAHGSLISLLKASSNIIKSRTKLESFPENNNYKQFPRVYVTHEKKHHSDVSQMKENFLENIVVAPGRIKLVWQSVTLRDLFNTLFTSWTIGHRPGNCDSQDELGKTFLSVFMLIDIGEFDITVSPREVLTKLYESLHQRVPKRSDELTLYGTPFGNEVFLNSLTNGAICNKVGRVSNILLCDAPSSTGFEGGPVFSKNGKKLIGMTISSLSWWRSEWVGITLIAFLTPVIHEILYPAERYQVDVIPSPKDLLFVPLLDEIDNVIALVRCGESWGSGVFINKGYILTCSHCVKNHQQQRVSIYLSGKSMKAKVVFRTQDDKAYDLALLKVDELNSSNCIKMAEKSTFKGENVVAVGFPYFNERQIKGLKPTITKGTVNNTTPYLMQTSCCVQSGYSGGAILRITTKNNSLKCYLLGIIVCNAKDDSNHVVFPNLNMAVPVNAFKDTLNKYFANPSSPDILRQLENPKQSVQALWRLQLYNSKL